MAAQVALKRKEEESAAGGGELIGTNHSLIMGELLKKYDIRISIGINLRYPVICRYCVIHSIYF